jgi:hypothetical protein
MSGDDLRFYGVGFAYHDVHSWVVGFQLWVLLLHKALESRGGSAMLTKHKPQLLQGRRKLLDQAHFPLICVIKAKACTKVTHKPPFDSRQKGLA